MNENRCTSKSPLCRSVELNSDWSSLFVCVESGFGRSRGGKFSPFTFTVPTVHSALACSHPLTVLCSAFCRWVLIERLQWQDALHRIERGWGHANAGCTVVGTVKVNPVNNEYHPARDCIGYYFPVSKAPDWLKQAYSTVPWDKHL